MLLPVSKSSPPQCQQGDPQLSKLKLTFKLGCTDDCGHLCVYESTLGCLMCLTLPLRFSLDSCRFPHAGVNVLLFARQSRKLIRSKCQRLNRLYRQEASGKAITHSQPRSVAFNFISQKDSSHFQYRHQHRNSAKNATRAFIESIVAPLLTSSVSQRDQFRTEIMFMFSL